MPQRSRLRDRLHVAEIQLAVTVDDPIRAVDACRSAAGSEDEKIRNFGLYTLGNLVSVVDSKESIRVTNALEDLNGDAFMVDANRAYVRMFAGEYRQALALFAPHMGTAVSRFKARSVSPTRVYFDATVAALLFMDGQLREALALAEHHPSTHHGWNTYGLVAGLSEQALGRRSEAERRLVHDARQAAFGRIPYASNASLVGLAALVHEIGDVVWAAEIILGASQQRLHAVRALARVIAQRIGVRSEVVERQEAMFIEDQVDATSFLRETLSRWDARRSTDQIVRT